MVSGNTQYDSKEGKYYYMEKGQEVNVLEGDNSVLSSIFISYVTLNLATSRKIYSYIAKTNYMHPRKQNKRDAADKDRINISLQTIS